MVKVMDRAQILKKIESKKNQLAKAKERTMQTWNNLGWGSGMRKTKLVSFSKEDNIRDEIKDLEEQLKNIPNS